MTTKPTPIPAAEQDRWPKPVEPNRAQLDLVLDRKPVLWVGERLSVAAGYPSTAELIAAMSDDAKGTLNTSGSFFEIADRFVDELNRGALTNLWQRFFGTPRAPTTAHHAIARLAKAGRLNAIITTNPDTLIEDALREAGVPYLLQTLEENAATTGRDELRVLKVHGSLTSWKNAIVSGRAYEAFAEKYELLNAQLDVLLQQRAVLLLGCSLQEPILLDWLARTPDPQQLEVWRAILTEKAWNEAMSYVWSGGHASGALARAKVRPMLIERDDDLSKLLGEVVAAIPDAAASIEINLSLGTQLAASLAGCSDWAAKDPYADPNFVSLLAELRERDAQALPVDARGQLPPEAQKEAAALRSLAMRIGDALADALLSPEARARVASAVRAAAGRTPPMLLLRVHGGTTDEERRRADRFLALPWELLRLDDEHPVEHGKLDLAREAVIDGAHGLDPPQRELSVVATVAAPVDAIALDYEGECYRLWQAMGAEERRLLITDLGTFDALVTAVQAHRPPVVHITGHGEPGKLLFETEEALSQPIEVRALVDRLRDYLPRLVFLASCYGGSTERTAHAAGDHRMVDPAALATDPTWSSAAELHREGVPQVVAWFGPVGDAQSTRAEGYFYAAIACGRTARDAVREARQRCRDPLMHPDGGSIYPLGWAQLAFYHRGADVPVTLPATAGVDIGGAERERISARLDKSHGPVGVERLVHSFVGRRSVRAEAIRRWRKGQHVLVVHGPGGFGKTALCAELAPILASKLGTPKPVRVVALDGRFAGQRGDAIMALWEQVAAFGEGDAAWNVELARLQKDGITGEALVGAVLWLARREGGLLVYVDDAESLQTPLDGDAAPKGELGAWRDAGLRVFWEKLAAATSKEKTFGLLASTRYVPEGVPDCVCLPLPVMREIDLVRLLRWWPTLGRLVAEDMAWLVARLEGHPRSVQWLEELAASKAEALVPPGGTFAGDLRREVLEKVLPEVEAKVSADMLLPRVIEAVGEEAKAHLGRCTVLAWPAPWGAIRGLEDVDGTGRKLTRAGLLTSFEATRQSLWSPHQMVMRAIGGLLTEERRAANHRVGGWFFEQWHSNERSHGPSDSNVIFAAGATYYLCEARDSKTAWDAAWCIIWMLRHRARYREALIWIDLLLASGAVGTHRSEILGHKVHMNRALGAEPQEIEALISEALGLVDDRCRGFVLSEQAAFLLDQGEVDRSIQVFRQAVLDARKQKDEQALAVALNGLGAALLSIGDASEASRHLEESIRIHAKVLRTNEHPEIAASRTLLAQTLVAQGQASRAEKILRRNLRFEAQAYQTRRHPQIAITLYALGGALMAQSQSGLARKAFEEILEIVREVRIAPTHRLVPAALYGIGLSYFKEGRLEEARDALSAGVLIVSPSRRATSDPDTDLALEHIKIIEKRLGDATGGSREAYMVSVPDFAGVLIHGQRSRR